MSNYLVSSQMTASNAAFYISNGNSVTRGKTVTFFDYSLLKKVAPLFPSLNTM